jgi:hypothetical protein
MMFVRTNENHLFAIPVQKAGRTLFKFVTKQKEGRAIAEAARRWLPTAAARVQSRVWSSGICGGQSGTKASFLRVLRFPLPFIPPNSPCSQSPGTGTIGQ